MFYVLAAALQGLTVREIVADIPMDMGAVITLLVVLLFIGFIWHGSRGGRDAGSPGD